LCSGLTACHWFEELSRREAADTAVLYAFDLIEHDGEDMRNRPFLDRKAAHAAAFSWRPVGFSAARRSMSSHFGASPGEGSCISWYVSYELIW
jgi:hypothetical protein